VLLTNLAHANKNQQRADQMKNFIAKDGVSDAGLIRAARDMYGALEACERRLFATVGNPFESELYIAVCEALTKARGEI
jgi:hypothetical protein